MSFAPQTLVDLRSYLHQKTGLDLASLGIVGNTSHTKGYHLGKDRIYDGSGPGLGDNDYSVKLARDKAGLTNAASAIDIGRFGQSGRNMKELVAYLFALGLAPGSHKSGHPMHDVREVIGTIDGDTVLGWARTKPEVLIPGYGDSSHLSHCHVSFMRDSESRAKTALFRPFFEEPWWEKLVRVEA